MKNQAPFTMGAFSSSLERILKKYEDGDCMLFTPVQLPKTSGNGQVKSTSISPRRTISEKRNTTATLHANPSKPLPNLAEDEDTIFLRNNISNLESQSLDLRSEIDSLKDDISHLQKQIANIQQETLRKSDYRVSPPKTLKSPLKKGRQVVTPIEQKEQEGVVIDYKKEYETIKAKYDGLKKVLEKTSHASRIPVSNFKQMMHPKG